jgi:hypothetical protein
MPTAHTLDEFLADAPRTALSTDSQYAAYLACLPNLPAASQCQNAIPPLQFDADAATYLNREFPLSMLAQSAESRTLPINLRQAIASMAWVRAVALQDPEIAARVSRLLPEPVRNEGGTQIGSRAILALLRAPGFRPYVDTGVQRSASYDYLDHFRDNWWCGRWTDGAHPDAGGLAAAPAPPLPFLTAKQREQAADEARRLNTLAQGLAWIGPLAFEYVTTHPEDKAAPEILAQLVQGTRWNCEAQTELSKRAFQLLHKRYPDTEWAKKTKYYY